MTAKWLPRPYVTLAVALAFLQVSCSTSHKQAPITLYPLDHAFAKISELTLPGVKARDVVGMATDLTGAIYVINSQSVEKFDRTGRALGVIGGSGVGARTICDSLDRRL